MKALLKIPNRAVVTSTLTVGEAPVQAEVDLELPPDQSLRPIEDTLRAQLGSAASTITVAPRRLSVRDDGMLACRVEVRSPTALELALLAEALALAVGRGEPDGSGEPVLAATSDPAQPGRIRCRKGGGRRRGALARAYARRRPFLAAPRRALALRRQTESRRHRDRTAASAASP